MDKKRISCVKLVELTKQIKTGQDKLNKISFNAQSFLNELAEAYDLLTIKGEKAPSADS